MLPEMLKTWRQAERHTLKEVAEQAGTSLNSVWRFENRKNIELNHAIKIIGWALVGKWEHKPDPEVKRKGVPELSLTTPKNSER